MTTTEILPIKKTTRSKPLLPYKFEDRLQGASVVRIPAAYDDFIELLVMCDYKVEYSNGDIVSILETNRLNPKHIMGNASLTHEQLVGNLSVLLGMLFFRQSDFILYGSNTTVFHTEGSPTYNPDLTIIHGQAEIRSYKFRKKTQDAVLNPWLVVEVLSQGTRDYDLVEKLANYRKIASLHHIIFVEQYWHEVTSYTRQANNTWSCTNLENLESELIIGTDKIVLSDIYNKVKFEK